MVIQAGGIAFIAAVEAAEVLRAAGEVSLGGGAQYLRDGQPVGVVAKTGQELARLACRRYGNDPGRYPSDTALNYERACRPYLDDIGEGAGPGLALPFRGGQCAGVNYTVTIASTTYPFGDCSTLGEGVSSNGYSGPIRGLRFAVENPSGELCTPGRNVAYLQHGPPGNESLVAGGGFGVDARIVSIVPEIPGTDTCGNPPPEVVQPEPPPFQLPPIVPIIIAPELDIDASVEVNLDGSISIDIGTGDITINPFGGDDDGGGGSDGGADDSPPAPEPGPDLPGGNGGFGGDDLFGEPPAGRRWVGCCITITARPTNQPPIPNTIPEDVYASVVGNIRLVYDAAGTRQTDTPVRIQARKVCVWEAVRKLNPVGVSVDLQPGFGYRYRPYSVPLDA